MKKRRAAGTACAFGRRCLAVTTYRDWRLCYKHAADVMMADHVKAEEGRCRRCGRSDDLQWAHVISRRYRAVRWARENSMALCRADHMYFTNRPLEWEDWCRTQGIDYDNLRYMALNDPPMDPLAVIEEMEAA